MSDQIKKIAIVGRDLDAWITALFLKITLDQSRNRYDIVLVDLGTELTLHDFYAVLPSYRMLHQTLGANEEKLSQSAKSHIYYAQRFSGWNPQVPDFFHAYDRYGVNFNGVDFFQYWLKARMRGLKVPLEEFSLGVAAAKHRKLVPAVDDTGLSHAAYGLHLSAVEYVNAISRAATGMGIKRIAGKLKQINHEGENLVSLVLQDGNVINADFYIDASGSSSQLISALSSNNFESWRHWFHCDRMISASSNTLSPRPAYSQITACTNGWCGLYPLAHRTAVQALYSSRSTDFHRVVDNVRVSLGVNVADGVDQEIHCGILKRPWIGNCLAVGRAAATIEPLDALQQHPLVISLVLLRQFFPNGSEYTYERIAYNKRIYSFVECLRDFQLAHYHLSSRAEPFWQAVKSIEPPPTLSEKIALFKQTGYLSIREDETFQEENWLSLFSGHGLRPYSYTPLADNLADEVLISSLQKILGSIRERIDSYPLI